MTALIRNGRQIPDPFQRISAEDEIPAKGAVLVPLVVWQDHWETLLSRGQPVGVQLASDEHPEIIGDDVDQIDLIALEFPTFRDGRAYSGARLIRERFGFTGELRAVGDVHLEQLHYMERVGFDTFELASADAEKDFAVAADDFSVWYQPSGDVRKSAVSLRIKNNQNS